MITKPIKEFLTTGVAEPGFYAVNRSDEQMTAKNRRLRSDAHLRSLFRGSKSKQKYGPDVAENPMLELRNLEMDASSNLRGWWYFGYFQINKVNDQEVKKHVGFRIGNYPNMTIEEARAAAKTISNWIKNGHRGDYKGLDAVDSVLMLTTDGWRHRNYLIALAKANDPAGHQVATESASPLAHDTGNDTHPTDISIQDRVTSLDSGEKLLPDALTGSGYTVLMVFERILGLVESGKTVSDVERQMSRKVLDQTMSYFQLAG